MPWMKPTCTLSHSQGGAQQAKACYAFKPTGYSGGDYHMTSATLNTSLTSACFNVPAGNSIGTRTSPATAHTASFNHRYFSLSVACFAKPTTCRRNFVEGFDFGISLYNS